MFLFKPKSETFHIVHQNNKNQQLPWLGIMSITRPTQEWQWRNILNPASVSLKLTFIVYVIVIFPIQGILHECIERKNNRLYECNLWEILGVRISADFEVIIYSVSDLSQ